MPKDAHINTHKDNKTKTVMHFFFKNFLTKRKTQLQDQYNYDLLTSNSPKIEDLPNTLVQLWDHQKAIVKRCQNIEEYTSIKLKIQPSNAQRYKDGALCGTSEANVGIMSDPPGSGKTYVALALIALDKSPSLNMIVVPPNLHHQWTDAINTYFSPGTFKYITITEYADTVQLWKGNQLFRDARVVITTTPFVEPVASAICSLSNDLDIATKIERVIIDEVDTSTSMFHSIPRCNRVWFMSASFDPQNHKKIGPFDISMIGQDDIRKLTCKCDPGFLHSFKDIKMNIITVPDGYISLFLNGVFPQMDIMLLNALNFNKVKSRYAYQVSPDETNCPQIYADLLVQAYKKEVDSLDEELDEKLYGQKTRRDELNDVVGRLYANIATFKRPSFTKLDKIAEVCDSIRNDRDTKWIFFSDDDTIFDKIVPILNERNLKCVSMSEGTFEKAESSIKQYKTDPDVRVLFINSMRDGCGLNLENTTHVLFLHFTNPMMTEQVIGRAQRPGRKTQLEVVCIYHENEMELIKTFS